MSEINRDKNHSTDVASKLIITDVINSLSFSITGSDLAFYASVYVEYNVGVYGQMYNAEKRIGEPSAATTYNNSWGNIYSNLLNLKAIIEKCSPGGNEEGNTVTLGIAQVLSAYALAILTDMFGDVPCTEALQPGVIWTPKLDRQEMVYNAINQFLTDGIANLEKESSMSLLGNQDPVYGGKPANWKKFAYGLKARYAMRLSKVKPDYDAAIAAAGKSFANVGEEAVFKKYPTIKNPFYLFFTDRDYFGASQSLHSKLSDRNDPRDSMFFKPYPKEKKEEEILFFAPNGNPEQKQGYYGISALATPESPVYLMSYHELEFLQAEAYLRKGDLNSAKTHLKNAVSAAFAKAGLTTAVAENYYTSRIEPKLTSATEALKETVFQKYLGLFESEAIETYNDIRRLKAMGEGDIIRLDNSLKFPLRYSYGDGDVKTNVNVREAYGNGEYVYSENVWWAGGTR
jgi:hypothetical protein